MDSKERSQFRIIHEGKVSELLGRRCAHLQPQRLSLVALSAMQRAEPKSRPGRDCRGSPATLADATRC